MKTITNGLICICLMIFSITANAQIIRCSTNEHEAALLKQNPKREKQKLHYEQQLQQFLQQNSQNRTQQTVITIPVVVHVVYATASQNISVAQITSQIEVLNQDFGRTNADTANTPAAFLAAAGASNIQFCLAQQDPSGVATTGIERRSSTVSSWSTNDAVKSFASGGLNAWDPSKYFNIWVCRLSGGILGYGEFPTSTISNTFGIVIDNRYFGTMGTATAPFNKGRTATHEVGHCFNLYHIWGDDGSACNGTDYCSDTPNQADENYNCPSYPHTDGCAINSPGVMFMNYMDYTDDACMNLFTDGQANRINAVIANAPYNALATSDGCQSPVSVVDDAGISSITSPLPLECSGTIVPEVVLNNYGSNALTSVNIEFVLDGGTPAIYNWLGSLASGTSTSVALPAISAASGSHTFQAYTVQPNGQTDGDLSNDTADVNFSIAGGSSSLALPYSEGFEINFPPIGMTINNPDSWYTWEQTSLAAKTGAMSIMMDNFDYDASGEIDEMILPAVDLTSGSTSNTSPYLSFQLAYRMYTNPLSVPNYSDTLAVLISTDCGTTFTEVYKKFGTQLTTIVPAFSMVEFVPGATNWRKDSIDLSPFETSNSVMVKFLHTTDFENNMYLDDINIYQSTNTGVKNISAASVSVYPNPVQDVLNIRLNEAARIEIYNVNGQLIYDSMLMLNDKVISVNVSGYTEGVYTIRATSATTVYPGRFVKQ